MCSHRILLANQVRCSCTPEYFDASSTWEGQIFFSPLPCPNLRWRLSSCCNSLDGMSSLWLATPNSITFLIDSESWLISSATGLIQKGAFCWKLILSALDVQFDRTDKFYEILQLTCFCNGWRRDPADRLLCLVQEIFFKIVRKSVTNDGCSRFKASSCYRSLKHTLHGGKGYISAQGHL